MKRKEYLGLIFILLVQTILFSVFGTQKSYLHMDEAYSLGLAQYDRVEIQDNEDFYDHWHEKEYYEDYLSVGEHQKYDYAPVYENQKNDVHPPFYYLLLRFFMGFHMNQYSKWPGIILNLLLSIVITIFIYLIVKQLSGNKIKTSLWITLLSSLLVSTITNAIYIRMYCLATLNIVLTTYFHLKLLDEKSDKKKYYIFIGLSALLGSLTHYYYLFYLAMLFLMMVIHYIKEKQYKELMYYIGSILIAAVLSLMIFPYSIQHMFFGYRGQGVIQKLMNVKGFLTDLSDYVHKLNVFTFHNLLWILVPLLLCFIIYYKIRGKKLPKNPYLKYIIYPSIFYFLLVAIASPFLELRYILPICPMIFIGLVFYLTNIISDKFLYFLTIALLLSPSISNYLNPKVSSDIRVEPEVVYSNRKEIVERFQSDLNVPTLYLFNSDCNRFLDDILLFSIIDHSYIAKDIDCNEQIIQEIMQNQDISKGIVVIINERQDNDTLVNTVKKAMGFENITYITHLSNSDVYYIK